MSKYDIGIIIMVASMIGMIMGMFSFAYVENYNASGIVFIITFSIIVITGRLIRIPSGM